ncbi:MAG: phosphoribosylformylglycinamidine synthase subunit PurL [Chloroflexi bacterium]|nr:phosphoribosylformylglycinamidine synthase subunit PurL [Chloroflexota bacterium]
MLADIAALGITGVTRVIPYALYFLRGKLTDSQVARLANELLADPIVQRPKWRLIWEGEGPLASPSDSAYSAMSAMRVEVGLLPGVTDSVAGNVLARAKLLGIEALTAVATGHGYLLHGEVSEQEARTIAQRLLFNEVIQYYELGELTPHVGMEVPQGEIRARVVPICDLDEEALVRLSRERLLSLDLNEMRTIQRYFQAEGREPTDVELESLAQTWSEHCVHKTFKARISYRERDGELEREEQIESLIRTYLQAATQHIAAPWVLSAFVDNAGIVDYTDEYEVSIKVETHNHPSALEPFGGANTGVGGVVRDIMGVSARPIANTDVLCFGPLDADMSVLPSGVLHPNRIYNGVVSGIEDYGNKMGIPTVNGAILFEPGYTANPLVYCGCVGIAPKGAHPRGARAGDLVVVLGGRTGRDGLHGATFSSISLTDETGEISGGAVQIGNPITEKMTLDAILVARDEGLYTAITDCGAGGLSSAVSEMGKKVGAQVQLATVPLKYQGLQPWEIWLSEAQERMVLAVPPEHKDRLSEVCAAFSVEMTVIGTFTGDGRLRLFYGDDVVADMSMAFLHEGLPQRSLEAAWTRPSHPEPAASEAPLGEELAYLLLQILAHPNVRSKEDVVRRYDHEVQSGTLIKPFVGLRADGPSDAAVLRPLEAREELRALALGCGMNPAYGALDPYAMAVSAIDEAVRNVVAVGADPERIAILDNFCWGNPNLPDRLGSLVRACKGCYDGAIHYGTPFVSGKDSLNNEYLDSVSGRQVSIPPSLLITALGIVPDINRACTMDLKKAGDALYILGETRRELGGSYYWRLRGFVGNRAPGLAERGPMTARALHRAMRRGLVRACHDLSEGGLAVALAETAFAGELGAVVNLGQICSSEGPLADDWLLFSESNGRYLVEVSPEDVDAFEALLADVPWARIGQVILDPRLVIQSCRDGGTLFSLPLEALRRAWRGHLPEERRMP